MHASFHSVKGQLTAAPSVQSSERCSATSDRKSSALDPKHPNAKGIRPFLAVQSCPFQLLMAQRISRKPHDQRAGPGHRRHSEVHKRTPAQHHAAPSPSHQQHQAHTPRPQSTKARPEHRAPPHRLLRCRQLSPPSGTYAQTQCPAIYFPTSKCLVCAALTGSPSSPALPPPGRFRRGPCSWQPQTRTAGVGGEGEASRHTCVRARLRACPFA